MQKSVTIILIGDEELFSTTIDSINNQSYDGRISIMLTKEENINTAIRNSDSDLFIFVNNGNVLNEQIIEKFVAVYEKNPAVGVVYCDEIVCDDFGKFKKFNQQYDRAILEQHCFIPTQSMISKKAILLAGKVDLELGPCKYWDLWLRATEHSLAIHVPGFLFQRNSDLRGNKSEYVNEVLERTAKRRKERINASK